MRSRGAQCVWQITKPISVVKPNFHALVGLDKGFVVNADLRSLRKRTFTNPKGQLAISVTIKNSKVPIFQHYVLKDNKSEAQHPLSMNPTLVGTIPRAATSVQ